MTHFPTESWVDFARGILAPERAAEMARHLETCSKCSRVRETWLAVAEISRGEKAYQPTSDAVRRAKAAFSLHKIWKDEQRPIARLIFDSLRQPLAMGIRSNTATARQLHYEAGPLLIDIEIRKDFEGKEDRVSLVGQVLKVAQPDERVPDFRIVLLRGKRFEAQTISSSLGEFHFELPEGKNWKLFFEIEGQEAIQVSLPSLTSRLPKARR